MCDKCSVCSVCKGTTHKDMKDEYTKVSSESKIAKKKADETLSKALEAYRKRLKKSHRLTDDAVKLAATADILKDRAMILQGHIEERYKWENFLTNMF
jgi:hypothetical protein